MKHLDSECIFEVGIGEKECSCDECECACKKDGKPTTTSSTATKSTYKINNNEVSKEEFDKKYEEFEEMYLDSFLTIASLDEEGAITKAIEKLDIISEKFKVKFILSVSKNIEQLPECAKAKVIISL